jgi:hypothetical protein
LESEWRFAAKTMLKQNSRVGHSQKTHSALSAEDAPRSNLKGTAMSIKITLAFVVVVIALASLTVAPNNHGSGSMRLSQYCSPPDDGPAAQTIYC